jgi:hypothetical protein
MRIACVVPRYDFMTYSCTRISCCQWCYLKSMNTACHQWMRMLHLNGCLSLVFGGKTPDAPSRLRRCYSRPPKGLGRATELLATPPSPSRLTHTLDHTQKFDIISTSSGGEDVIIHNSIPQELFDDCHSHSWRKPSPANLSRSPRDNEKPECRSCDALRRV